MAYYISLSQGFTFPIRDRKVHYNPKTGDVMSVDPAVTVQFRPSSSAPEHALKAVATLPAFGRGIGLNESPYERIGSFDTFEAQTEYGWSDETRKYVEEVMDRAVGVYFVRADYPAAVAPWPNYDNIRGNTEKSAETIARKVEEDGYDVAQVLGYERQNLDRDKVVAALEALVVSAGADLGPVIQA